MDKLVKLFKNLRRRIQAKNKNMWGEDGTSKLLRFEIFVFVKTSEGFFSEVKADLEFESASISE